MEVLNLQNDVSSIVKRDGVLLGSAGILGSYLRSKTNSKVATKIGTHLSAKSIAKGLKFVELANIASTTVQELLPHVSEAMDWSMALPFNVLNQTLGRIPGIGALFRWIHNAVTKLVTKGADMIGWDGLAVTGSKLILEDPNKGFETEVDFSHPGKKANWLSHEDESQSGNNEEEGGHDMRNNPNWYTNLDLHKTFSIPGGYTKTTVVNGTLATPKIVAHRIYENAVPDVNALIDRLNQKFSLIKAVRGLSATSYNVLDLANYERLVKIALLEYYTIKKVVSAAKTFSLVQVEIGNNIIDSLGFVPSEVRQNLSNYETLLCQYHRFISNNMPCSGTWIQRLEYLVGANVPDYSDQKVATIHTFSVSMSNVFYDPANPTNTLVFDCIPGAANNNYNVMLTNFDNICAILPRNKYFQELIADYFGAFGTKAVWSDKAYPEYAQPLNLRNADNDLCREQIKNAFYINAKLELITINAGVENKKIALDTDDPTLVQMPTYQFGTSSYTGQANNALNYSNLLDADAYMATFTTDVPVTSLGATNYMLIPDMNGIAAQSISVGSGFTNVDMANHETIYTLHKDSYSEGESLEISQFKCRSIGIRFGLNDSDDYVNARAFFKTHEYAVLDSVCYVYGSNGTLIVPQTYVICNEAISDDDLQDTESPVDFPDEIMNWCLIDWMPLAHFTFFGYASATSTYSPRDIAAIDMDAFGSLDDRAFKTSINYSIYSLQAASLVVGKKRMNNLNDVYKDKASREG